MKKFSFGLGKVLELREFEEEQAKLALAQALSVTEKIRNELQDIAEKRVSRGNLRDSTTDVLQLQAIDFFIQRLDIKKEELLVQLTEAELVVDEKRNLFAEAMKNRKTISKLEEKQKLEYRKNMFKEEEKLIDDITSGKSAREE